MNKEASQLWTAAKQAVTRASPGLIKWWTNQRYQGHRKQGAAKCKCEENSTIT